MWNDFKEFIARGNVLDLAVAVILGVAFGAIVTSLVDDIIMPLVGIVLGGVDFSGLALQVEDATFASKGKTGLWTKADSVTYFDDLRIDKRR